MLLVERSSASDGPTPPSEPAKGHDAPHGFFIHLTRPGFLSIRSTTTACAAFAAAHQYRDTVRSSSLVPSPFFPPSDLHVTRRGGRWQQLPASHTISASLLFHVTSTPPKMSLSLLLPYDIHGHRSGGHGGWLPVSHAPSLPPYSRILVCCAGSDEVGREGSRSEVSLPLLSPTRPRSGLPSAAPPPPLLPLLDLRIFVVASVPVSQISSLFCNGSFSMLQQMMWNVATVPFFGCCNTYFSDVAEQFLRCFILLFHQILLRCCRRFFFCNMCSFSMLQ